MTNGFRYWTAYFYGIVELSSLPLAIMNVFKDNPKLVKKYPGSYQFIRLVFALSFLWIRLVLWFPRMTTYLRDMSILVLDRPHRGYQIYMGFVWFSSFFLTCLQVLWATLIVKDMAKTLLPHRKKEKEG